MRYWVNRKHRIKDEEYSILVNAAKSWGKNDPKEFIDKKINDDKIHCDDTGNITKVDLSNSDLCNFITDEICYLTSLQILNLSNNNLRGPIPMFIGNLESLKELRLNNNQLGNPVKDDKIPPDTPIQLGLINKLEVLDLSSNEFTGPIPSSIGSLRHLIELNLHTNKLTCIPNEIGNLIFLEKLYCQNNLLKGSVPEFSNLTKLIDKDNCFQGNLGFVNKREYDIIITAAKDWGIENPHEFIEKKLRENKIRYNDSGEIILIDLSNKELSTTNIGCCINNKDRKLEIDSRAIELKGPIPKVIGKLRSMKSLTLNCNNLSGNIPHEIFKLTNLVEFDLSSNNLTGSISEDIYKLNKLKTLDLSRNEITGSFPDIGTLKNLETLYLSKNKLSGSISESVSILTSLKILDVSGNNLEGAIPAMRSTNCKINISDTKITPVQVKTKFLKSGLDYVCVIFQTVLGYFDLITDILAILALSHNNVPIMVANIVFLVLGIFLTDWKKDISSLVIRVLQLDPLYQCINTIRKKEQTVELVMEKKLDVITRSIPSMVLQLYGLLKSLSEASRANITTLFISIGSAILGAGFTLASQSPNSGSSVFSTYFVTHYIYYITEVTSRVLILGIMFFAIGSYGFIILGLDFTVRLLLSIFGFHFSSWMSCQSTDIEKSLGEGLVEAVQMFGSDFIVNREEGTFLYIGFCINTVEMFLFLGILNTLENPQFAIAHKKGAIVTLTVIACVTWFIRLLFYVSGVLDIDIIPDDITYDDVNRISDSDYNFSISDDDNDEIIEEAMEAGEVFNRINDDDDTEEAIQSGEAFNRINDDDETIEEAMESGVFRIN